MNSPFPFDALLVFGFLSIMLLLGTLIRGKVTVVQRFLFPSCLIGGVVGSVLINTNLIQIGTEQLESFAYHCFNISFISAGLTREANPDQTPGKKGNFLKGTLWMALVQGITFPMQAVIGGLVVLIFGWFGSDLFVTFGFFAPLGFNEGPGQALSIGKVWEGMGFEHAATIGLTIAALGFFFAFFVGVPLANWGIRKGLAAGGGKELSSEVLRGYLPRTKLGESAGNMPLHPSNIDSLAFQAAAIGLVYVITYFVVDGISGLLGADSAKMVWGFFFFFGLAIAILVRFLMDTFKVGYLVDAGIQKRITGWSVDFLIVATVPAIQIAVVWKYALPITIISALSGILTTWVVLYLGRRLLSENLERIVAIYGTVTGTVSSGLLLLRIVDPEFKTSVTLELAIMNIFVLPIIFGCMMLVNAPLWWGWSLEITMLVFTAIGVVCYVLMRLLHLIEKRKF